MNILTVALTCLLVYYLYQGFRPLKRQKGGGKGVVIAVVLLLLAGGGVAAYFLLKDDSSPSPSPTPSPVGNSGDGQHSGGNDLPPRDPTFQGGEMMSVGHTIGNYKPTGISAPASSWSLGNSGDRTTAFVEGSDKSTVAKNCYKACLESSPKTGAKNDGGDPYCTRISVTNNPQGVTEFVGACNPKSTVANRRTHSPDPNTKQVHCGPHNCLYTPSGFGGGTPAANWTIYTIDQATFDEQHPSGSANMDFYKVGSGLP